MEKKGLKPHIRKVKITNREAKIIGTVLGIDHSHIIDSPKNYLRGVSMQELLEIMKLAVKHMDSRLAVLEKERDQERRISTSLSKQLITILCAYNSNDKKELELQLSTLSESYPGITSKK